MVEFAFVGPMFLLLLLAIMEVGLLLFSQTLLDTGTRDAARLIRTGQASTIGTIQTAVCNDMGPLLSASQCASQVLIQAQTFTDYGSIAFTSCTQNANGTGKGTSCPFSTGSGNSIVGVQIVYQRTYLIPWVSACLTGGKCWTGLGSSFGPGGTGYTNLVSTVIFKNEPF